MTTTETERPARTPDVDAEEAGGANGRGDVPGIVIADGAVPAGARAGPPRIVAFIWGGKVRPAPTLPYGRWKGAA